MSSLILIVLAIGWWIYSYGFVDFNLTLSSNRYVMSFVTAVQRIVYFNRSQSFQIFLTLLVLSFVAYGLCLRMKKFPWRVVLISSGILALAYPMLSADSFKYLFTAKELLLYHVNPALVPPNAFPGDLWIRFMRWVHTPSPYGPALTGLMIVPYVLGFGKFVPALYLLKLMNWGWYLLAVWVVGKLAGVKAQLYLALNPLILMEWLINAHNDAPMIALLLLAVYLLSIRKRIVSFAALLVSIGIKYVTVFALPLVFIKKFSTSHLRSSVYYLLTVLAVAPLLYNYTSQYQPWYVTWLVPFAATVDKKWIKWTVAAYSLSVFSRYFSYISTGFWDSNQMTLGLSTFVLPVVAGIVALAVPRINRSK